MELRVLETTSGGSTNTSSQNELSPERSGLDLATEAQPGSTEALMDQLPEDPPADTRPQR